MGGFLINQFRPLRIGWIIGNHLEESRFLHRIHVNIGGISLVRYHWIANQINSNPKLKLKYNIYHPWKKYDALIFLKSMGTKSIELIQKYQDLDRPILFDANVNYYQIEGREYYQGMLPTEQQKRDAIAITEAADGIIADSEFIMDRCKKYNSNVCWIPDNIRLDLVPRYKPWKLNGGRLLLLWSGESIKLFELLVIEDILKKYSSCIELILVTNSLSALDRWYPPLKERFEAMLRKVPHRIIPYKSIEHLFEVYSQGGISISPRFLDNSYNMGHTEWKITLAMACGRMALCSPVPSYLKVACRAEGQGIRICNSIEDWDAALEDIFYKRIDWGKEELGAKSVVEKYYSTVVIAKKHAEFVNRIVNKN